MGYTAEQAGMALSAGGFVVIMLLPFVGRAVGKVDPRWLIAFGFTASSAALFYMTTHLNQGMDFKQATLLRVYQSVGLAFLFVPINTLVYNGVPPEKNNAVSGIVNLSRNMGGDVGIAFVTTFLARRSQAHEANLAAHTSPFDPPFQSRLTQVTAAFEHTGASATTAAHKALGALYGQFVQQATTLAYIDVLEVMGVATALMVPLLLLTQKPKGGGPAPGGH
jgi:DHA2 family multidrug resistance protein